MLIKPPLESLFKELESVFDTSFCFRIFLHLTMIKRIASVIAKIISPRGCPRVILERNKTTIKPTSTLNATATLFGTSNFKTMIISGNVIRTATVVEASKVDETTNGIGLINSPIIPLDSSSGTKAQTVVIVVVQIGTRKSFHTNNPVSAGVNLFVL
jgi:hypothetical protein